jgi:hypothetical protein
VAEEAARSRGAEGEGKGGMSITAQQVREALDRQYRGEWVFIDELRNGTGYTDAANGYMDGFAINCYPSKRFHRIAFEIKVSRSDFTREMRKPMKRKVALLYSTQFDFVTPPGMLKPEELPPEAGLMEMQEPYPDQLYEWGAKKHNPHPKPWLKEIVPAPWRDTPPPSWSLFCSMARKLRKEAA